jgi:arylsulfatase A-like enzyme
MRHHDALKGAAFGLLIGVLLGTIEVLRVAWFIRGGTFRPDLLVDAWLIDGGILAVLCFLLGALRSLFRRRPRSTGSRVARRYEPAAGSASPAGSRRTVLRLAATGLVGVGVLGIARWLELNGKAVTARVGAIPASADSAGDAPRPNVVLITVDTLRADQLGCYGHPFVKTPALDAFAAQGARFGMHLIQEPQTNPSHCSMFTGMYPSSSGVRIHMVDKLPNTLDTLATTFSKAGYATAGLYSWMSFDPQYCNFQRGFDVYQDLTLNKPGLLSNPVVKQAAANYRVAEQYLVVPKQFSTLSGLNSQVESASKGRADQTTDAAIAQLRAFGSRPFFLWLHYFDPHYPYEPPGQYASLYDPDYRGSLKGDIATVDAILAGKLEPAGADLQRLVSLYQGEITYLDSQISRLFASLDQLGLTANTVVAVTGDHGESFAEHTQLEEDGNIFHPKSLYNAEARVPLMLRYPRAVKAGTVVNVPTQAVDLFPTLLEFAGLSVPGQSEGTSAVGLLSCADNGQQRLAFAAMPDYVFTAVASTRWKLIQNNASNQRHLYDLSRDINETHDVLAANADVAAQLSGQLTAWMKAVKISS